VTPEQEGKLLDLVLDIAEALEPIAKWYRILDTEGITPPEIPSPYTIACPNCGQPMQETEISYACKNRACGHVMKKLPYVPPRPSEAAIPEMPTCWECGMSIPDHRTYCKSKGVA